jgi:hypothetical protein
MIKFSLLIAGLANMLQEATTPAVFDGPAPIANDEGQHPKVLLRLAPGILLSIKS